MATEWNPDKKYRLTTVDASASSGQLYADGGGLNTNAVQYYNSPVQMMQEEQKYLCDVCHNPFSRDEIDIYDDRTGFQDFSYLLVGFTSYCCKNEECLTKSVMNILMRESKDVDNK